MQLLKTRSSKKQNFAQRLMLASILFFITLPTWALGNLFDIISSDQSITLLGHMLGAVGDIQLGVGQGVGLFGVMFRLLNTIIIIFSSILMSYTIILSVIRVPSQGDQMAQKWTSKWIPFRSVLGISLLIPTQSGYSLIQIIVMWIVLQGVGAANSIWNTVLDYWVDHGATPTVDTSIDTHVVGLDALVNDMFEAYICMYSINELVPGAVISEYITPSPTDPNTSLLNFGERGKTNYESICGQIKFPAIPDTEMRDNKLSGVVALGNWVKDQAYDIAISSAFDPILSPQPRGYMRGAKLAYANRLTQYLTDVTTENTAWLDVAKQNGWALAGMYFFYLGESAAAQLNQYAKISPLFTTNPNTEFVSVVEPEVAQKIIAKQTAANVWLSNVTPGADETEEIKLDYKDAGGSSAVERVWRSSFGKLGILLLDTITKSIHGTDNPTDILKMNPLVNIRSFGTNVLLVTELIWIAATVLISVLSFIMAWPVGTTITVGMVTVVGWLGYVIAGVLALVWAAMASWAYYLPLIPYIVFTLGVVGWIIMVFEALIASPLLAIGLISPGQDALGRARSGTLIIVQIFLRPSLMIFGFIASIYLMRVSIYLLNLTFIETFKASAGTISIFGVMAVLTIYTGLMTTIIHKCFSLIYHVPDKVMKWVNHQAQGIGEGQAEQEVRRGAQEGGQKGAAASKAGALGAASGASGQEKKGAAKIVKSGANITGK